MPGESKRIYIPQDVDFEDLIERAAGELQDMGIDLRPYGARLAWTNSDVIVKALQILVGDIEAQPEKVKKP